MIPLLYVCGAAESTVPLLRQYLYNLVSMSSVTDVDHSSVSIFLWRRPAAALCKFFVIMTSFCDLFVAVVVSLCTSPLDEEHVRTTTFWGVRNIKKVPTEDRKDTYRLTEKIHYSADGSLQEELPLDVREEKCLDGAHVIPLIPSTDCDPETPSTETSPLATTPEQSGSARSEMIRKESCHVSGETSHCRCFLQWFWGYKEGAQSSKQDVVPEDARAIAERLYEPPRIKTLLNVGLFINVCLAIFMYVFFSL